MDLSQFASTPDEGRQSSSKPLAQDVIDFVANVVKQGYRLTYGGLSLITLPNGSPKMNRGQHGSAMAKKLPVELQPGICPKSGDYHTKALQAFREGNPSFKASDWVDRKILFQDAAVKAFAQAQAENDSEE